MDLSKLTFDKVKKYIYSSKMIQYIFFISHQKNTRLFRSTSLNESTAEIEDSLYLSSLHSHCPLYSCVTYMCYMKPYE